MNCNQAKNIAIIDFLNSEGTLPKTVKNGSAWYNSPFRDENKPSFKVNTNRNIWYDFGLGKGGGIIDLIMILYNTDIAGALTVLQNSNLTSHSYFSFEQQKPIQSSLQINDIRSLQNYALQQYLSSRNISPTRAGNFVKEAYYQIKDKNYFALAFKNDKGGYELRNKYFKGGNSPKAITTIKGFSKTINIFEGFIDFLSALEYYNIRKPANTTIVLNSISNLKSVYESLQQFKRINLYLDNDPAGKKTAKIIESEFDNVKNYSGIIYPNYKDFNDLLHKRDNQQKSKN